MRKGIWRKRILEGQFRKGIAEGHFRKGIAEGHFRKGRKGTVHKLEFLQESTSATLDQNQLFKECRIKGKKDLNGGAMEHTTQWAKAM